MYFLQLYAIVGISTAFPFMLDIQSNTEVKTTHTFHHVCIFLTCVVKNSWKEPKFFVITPHYVPLRGKNF